MTAFFSYSLPLQGDVKLVTPIFFLVVGAGFVFLNLEEKAFDWYHYFRGVRKAEPTDRSGQALIGIENLANDVIYLKKGALRAILQVEPINFKLLDENQRKAVILNYREFLNHLTTPIQILVRTSQPDLVPYFEQAAERLEGASDNIKSLFAKFLVFEQDFIEENHVRERRFYLVVSQEKTSNLLAKTLGKDNSDLQRLEEKTRIIQEKLEACGLHSTRLENASLRKLLAEYSSQEANESDDDEKENQQKQEKPSKTPG